MQEKLKEMEDLVLKMTQVAPEVVKAQKLKKKKIMKQEQLAEQRLEELNHEEQDLIEGENDGQVAAKTSEEKAEYWRALTVKLRNKLKNAIQDKKDVCKEFEQEREDLNKTIRDMEGDLSFYRQLVEKFISEGEIAILKENSSYDEEKRLYTLPPFMMH